MDDSSPHSSCGSIGRVEGSRIGRASRRRATRKLSVAGCRLSVEWLVNQWIVDRKTGLSGFSRKSTRGTNRPRIIRSCAGSVLGIFFVRFVPLSGTARKPARKPATGRKRSSLFFFTQRSITPARAALAGGPIESAGLRYGVPAGIMSPVEAGGGGPPARTEGGPNEWLSLEF